MKTVFFGTPVFAIPVLKKLIDNGHDVVGVFTGNGPIELEAKQLGIRIFKPTSLRKGDDIFEQFKFLNPDLCVVAAYGKIIPSRYLNVPKYGFLNVHPSLLPKYRGPSPIQTAILNGEANTGVTIMIVDEEVDLGPILASREFPISNPLASEQFSNHDELAKKLFELGAKLLIEIITKYVNGEIKPIPQDHSQATFTKIFTREDGRINWSEPAEKIYNQIRALNPEPGAWTLLRLPGLGEQSKIMNILTSQIGCSRIVEEVPGTVVGIDGNVAVATKTCYLILKQIQLEGGKEMDARSFVNGHPDFLNSKLE